jgi:DNA anti-recombination protein RmuC
MTFKISQKDKARIDSVAHALREQAGKLDDAVRIFNEQLDAARIALGSAVGAYNEALGTAKNLVEDVHREMQAEFEARSEKWRGGNDAEPVQTWISELETIYLGLDRTLAWR